MSNGKLLQSMTFALLLAVIINSQPGAASYAQQNPTPAQLTQDFDYLWVQLRHNYAYFDKKETDWNRVRDVYRPRVAAVTNKTDFITLLERVLDELYDPHTHLRVNTNHSTRLIPTGLDVWAEWEDGKAVVTQLRSGFSAEQAGLRVGMEIVAINGVLIETAINNRLGVTLTRVTDAARSWALRALLAGTRDAKRVVTARIMSGATKAFLLDLPAHRTVDNYGGDKNIEWKILKGRLGYIKICNLGSDDTVRDFDTALEKVKGTRGLIIDLRATQSGGDTSVAEPIMGRLISHPMFYQKGVPRHGADWTKEVSPRGPWTYSAPIVVLVGRWTASMGEGMAIGLDAMNRATIVGTPMAGLNGAVFDLQLPNTGIKLNYAAEKLFHPNRTPREMFVPPVSVKLSNRTTADLILTAGIRTLRKLVGP
jgi:C-terminal processing protease CtpA/Prc